MFNRILMGRLDLKHLKKGDDTCVIDYIWEPIRGKRDFRSYTYQSFKEELRGFSSDKFPQMATDEIKNWVSTATNSASLHAYDVMFEKFDKYIVSQPTVVLCCICKDSHLIPIKNERLKMIATKANGGCDNLLTYMRDFTWTKKHNKFVMCEKIEVLFHIYHKFKNHIVVLTEDI